MALTRQGRTRLALSVAPLATVPVLIVIGAATLPDVPSFAMLIQSMLHSSFFIAFFGLPVAYFTEGVLLLLVRACGRSEQTTPGFAVVGLGVVAGFLVFGLFGLGSFKDWMLSAGAGTLMGGAASALFVLIRGRPDAPSPANWEQVPDEAAS